MVSFRRKTIATEKTLGEYLRSVRLDQGVAVEKAARDTHISKDYLCILEEGRYDLLPGDFYAKHFLKVYGRYLGLDVEKLLDLYKREKAVFSHTKKELLTQKRHPARVISRLHFLLPATIVRNVLILGIVAVCLLYLGMKVEAIIRPPELEVRHPLSDFLTSEKFIEVRGKADPGSEVVVNNQKAIVDQEGNFFQKISLVEGWNEITISAKKDHSRTVVIKRSVVVREDEGE